MRLLRVGLSLLAICCSTIHVTTQVSPEADFSRVETFFLLPIPEPTASSQLYTRAIGESIQRRIAVELEAKGFRPAPREAADVEVAFSVTGRPRSEIRRVYDSEGYWFVRKEWTEKNFAINVIDGRRERLLWHGHARVDITREKDAEPLAEAVVRKVLSGFPPQPAAVANTAN